jgi:hypothetical protein
MVVQFNEERLQPVAPQELERIRISAEHGDLSTIMPSYEKEIESPIRNALFSDFARLGLIQVQKQKGASSSLSSPQIPKIPSYFISFS